MASNIITADGKDLDERYMPKGTSIPPRPNAHVTQTWHSGENWWRKWSDGFIEQGGGFVRRPTTSSVVYRQTINLHTPFTTSTYVAVANVHDTAGSYALGVTKSTNKFVINSEYASSVSDRNWYACGY